MTRFLDCSSYLTACMRVPWRLLCTAPQTKRLIVARYFRLNNLQDGEFFLPIFICVYSEP